MVLGWAEPFKEAVLQVYENQLKAKGENVPGMDRKFLCCLAAVKRY